jgi:hypothetical protein
MAAFERFAAVARCPVSDPGRGFSRTAEPRTSWRNPFYYRDLRRHVPAPFVAFGPGSRLSDSAFESWTDEGIARSPGGGGLVVADSARAIILYTITMLRFSENVLVMRTNSGKSRFKSLAESGKKNREILKIVSIIGDSSHDLELRQGFLERVHAGGRDLGVFEM